MRELFGIGFWIARKLEGLDPKDARGGVVPVPTATRRNWKPCDDYIRMKLANDPDDIGEHLFPIPETQRFFRRFRETEINGAGEKLAATVKLARGQQFLGACHTELLVKLRANFVLPSIAPRER